MTLTACSTTPSIFKQDLASTQTAVITSTEPTQTAAVNSSNDTEKASVQSSYLGKLNLQIIAHQSENTTSQDRKSFNLDFELTGRAKQGQLDLMGPLGAQLAQIKWNANSASLRQGKKELNSENLNALLYQALGAEFPVQALFSWLESQQTQELQNQGWLTQNADLASGKRGLRLEQKITNPPNASTTFTTIKILLILNTPENNVAQ